MISSREDFVIAIRSAFLKKGTQQRFSLISLIILAILLIFLSSLNFKIINQLRIIIKETVYRSSFVVSIPENYVKNTYKKINDHFNHYKDYEKIKLDLDILKSEKVVDNFLSLENQRLNNDECNRFTD